MLYGRSLSLCVSDILEGKIRFEDVGGIVAGTSAATDDQWASVIDQYMSIYWRWHSYTAAVGIVQSLLKRGLIYQPRLMDSRVNQNIYPSGIWASSLSDALATLNIKGVSIFYPK